MRKLFYIVLVGFLSTNMFAQSKMSKLHSNQNIDCASCHVCKTPTKKDPCLSLCPRVNKNIKSYKVKNAPKVFSINNIHGEKDLFGPVNFTHKAHAEMAEMGNGCVTCHHNNSSGKIEKCSTCHTEERSKSNPDMPDLKSAYHRQCMGCHTTWEEETKCESCHAVNDEYKSAVAATEIVKVHKPVERPVTRVFHARTTKVGKIVTFHHEEHIELFGLQCTDCHQNESCATCHSQDPNFKKANNKPHHSNCNSCHNTEDKKKCETCHSDKETKAFNHFTTTGFDISIYHSKVSCNSCHTKKGSYKGLNSQCQSCHTWDEDNFNHAITGLRLNEDHIDNSCSDCHEDEDGNLNYQKPSCTNCHDEEDDGISYPNKLPGKRIK